MPGRLRRLGSKLRNLLRGGRISFAKKEAQSPREEETPKKRKRGGFGSSGRVEKLEPAYP